MGTSGGQAPARPTTSAPRTGPSPCFLLRQRAPEVLRLDQLANLDLTVLERRALEPLDRFGLGFQLPDPEATDQFLRLRERTVDHGPLRALELHSGSLRAGPEPLGHDHHPGPDQLVVELGDLREDLLLGKLPRLRILV